jgi:O-antigen/teichoic acid export membrane protein
MLITTVWCKHWSTPFDNESASISLPACPLLPISAPLTDMASTLRVDTAVYGSAMMIDRLLGFFLLPLLTRAIVPADYGAWTQTAVAAGLLVPLVLFGSSTAVVRYFSTAASARIRRRFFAQLGAVALLLLALCVALASTLPLQLAAFVYGEAGYENLIPILLVLLTADAATEFSVAWLRAAGHIGGVAAALVLRSAVRYGVVLMLVSDVPVPLMDWIGYYAAAQLALALVVLAATLYVLRRTPVPSEPVQPPRLRELLAFSAPLVALSLFTSLNSFLDRFVLVQWLGLDGVAVYAAAVSLCTIPAAFYSVLGFTLFPVLARHWQVAQLDEAARLVTLALRVFLFLCVPVAALLAVGGHWVLPLLTTGAYVAPSAVFALLGLSISAAGSYQILLYALLLDGRSRQVLGLAVLATAINLALNLWLARRWGVVGAACAAAVSNLVMVGVSTRLVHQVLRWSFPWSGVWTTVCHAALAALPLGTLLAWGAPSLALAAAAFMLGGAAYLALDWRRPDSITRKALGQ